MHVLKHILFHLHLMLLLHIYTPCAAIATSYPANKFHHCFYFQAIPLKMSITSCFLLVLLCLSLHASTARRLRKVYNNNTLEKKLHFHIKTDTKNGFRKNTVAAAEATSPTKGEGGHGGAQKQEDGEVNHKSVVSVSWRLPRDKRGVGKHPGFNVDYSLPRTHPPSHY